MLGELNGRVSACVQQAGMLVAQQPPHAPILVHGAVTATWKRPSLFYPHRGRPVPAAASTNVLHPLANFHHQLLCGAQQVGTSRGCGYLGVPRPAYRRTARSHSGRSLSSTAGQPNGGVVPAIARQGSVHTAPQARTHRGRWTQFRGSTCLQG